METKQNSQTRVDVGLELAPMSGTVPAIAPAAVNENPHSALTLIQLPYDLLLKILAKLHPKQLKSIKTLHSTFRSFQPSLSFALENLKYYVHEYKNINISNLPAVYHTAILLLKGFCKVTISLIYPQSDYVHLEDIPDRSGLMPTHIPLKASLKPLTEHVDAILVHPQFTKASPDLYFWLVYHNLHSRLLILHERHKIPQAILPPLIHVACRKCHSTVLNFLLKLSPPFPDLDLCLLEVIRQLNYDCARQLVEKGATDPSGACLIFLCGKWKKEKFISLLISDGASDPSRNDWEILKIVCKLGQVDILRLFNKYMNGEATTAANNLAVRLACKFGHVEMLQYLLFNIEGDKPDVTCLEQECVRVACENGHVGILKILLQLSEVDPSAKNNECITLAAFNGLKFMNLNCFCTDIITFFRTCCCHYGTFKMQRQRNRPCRISE
jgi:hypothetical protein